MLQEFACHPCSGAMLIFSVLFQLYYMCCQSEHPLQYSCLGNPMDREAWRATVHGVAKSQT